MGCVVVSRLQKKYLKAKKFVQICSRPNVEIDSANGFQFILFNRIIVAQSIPTLSEHIFLIPAAYKVS